ncbi:MAG: DUF1559 domain-containing protein [Planctomycetaceae bacterium]|nr:DUF1559 domain-containing protein [Planctomycetaceae bacterium]
MKSPVFVSLICLGIVILMVLFLMMPSLEEPRGVARQRQSKINLKMIGLAMHNYHHMHGMLPPGKIVTQDGGDYHGWPALSLPFLDSAPIYNSINFDQPFDTPDNQSVMQVPYRWFQNPMLTE